MTTILFAWLGLSIMIGPGVGAFLRVGTRDPNPMAGRLRGLPRPMIRC